MYEPPRPSAETLQCAMVVRSGKTCAISILGYFEVVVKFN